MSGKFKIIFILGVLLNLHGCATSYAPYGLGGGYKERKVDDDTYIVSFFGNGHASEQRVWNFWFYRCAELTLKKGYEYFEIRPSKEHAGGMDVDGQQPYIFSMLQSGKVRPVEAAFNQPVYYVITTYSSKAYVNMFKGSLPKNVGLAYDAKTVIKELKPYIDSNAKKAPPFRKDLLVRSAVEAAIRTNRIRENQRGDFEERLQQAL